LYEQRSHTFTSKLSKIEPDLEANKSDLNDFPWSLVNPTYLISNSNLDKHSIVLNPETIPEAPSFLILVLLLRLRLISLKNGLLVKDFESLMAPGAWISLLYN